MKNNLNSSYRYNNQHDYLDIEPFLASYRDAVQKDYRRFIVENYSFKTSSQRYELFNAKGTTCVKCNLKANMFVVESHNKETPHANLYYISDDNSQIVLFTKDHIFPKSHGGANTLENYQVMCSPCNNQKGNTIEQSV